MPKNFKNRGFGNKKKLKKSPLKGKPHRFAGQSVQEEMDRLLDEKFMMYYLGAAFFSLLAGLEWWAYYNAIPRLPWMWTLTALLAVIVAIYQFFKLKNNYSKLKLGRDGEQAVGQYLDSMRHTSFMVFHDIVGDGFNIDHVVICEQGVFAIETKTYSKPASGKAEIKSDGHALLIDGYRNEQISVQARAIKASLRSLIEPYMAKPAPIRAAVIFPGWYVDVDHKKLDFWALHPKGLMPFIEHCEKVLTVDDVRALSNHFSRVIRPVQ